MFLKIIKNFLLKNKVSKLLSNTPANHSAGIIQSVGVIFDGNLNIELENVLKELVEHGIDENQIKVLIFKNKINKNEVFKHELVTYKEFNWSGELTHSKAELFFKSDYVYKLPYNLNLYVKKDSTSYYYWQLIKEVGKKSVLK